MTETDEKPEERKPAKQGLHGWKAALAVFGCGSLAAFAFFGVLAGAVSSVLGFASNGPSGDGDNSLPEGIEQAPKPRDSIETGALDLCNDALPAVDEVQMQRIDAGGNFSDPGEGQQPRSVTDDCLWQVSPASGGTWEMSFTYEAYVADSSGDEASDLAEEGFEDKISDLQEVGVEESSSGDADIPGEAHYVHGVNEEGLSVYSTIVRSGDTVYEMSFESSEEAQDGGSISKEEFEYEIDNIVSYVEVWLTGVGPGKT